MLLDYFNKEKVDSKRVEENSDKINERDEGQSNIVKKRKMSEIVKNSPPFLLHYNKYSIS